MSDEDDYMALLNRAKIACPETIENHERFEIPELEILQEGKITVFRNFIDVTDKLRRDPQHVLQFLLKELGAPGNVEGRRAVFKAKISPNQINDKIQMYTETYVICSECGLPDTKMVKDGRTLMLECEACGARRPITVRKSVRADSPSPSGSPSGPTPPTPSARATSSSCRSPTSGRRETALASSTTTWSSSPAP